MMIKKIEFQGLKKKTQIEIKEFKLKINLFFIKM